MSMVVRSRVVYNYIISSTWWAWSFLLHVPQAIAISKATRRPLEVRQRPASVSLEAVRREPPGGGRSAPVRWVFRAWPHQSERWDVAPYKGGTIM